MFYFFGTLRKHPEDGAPADIEDWYELTLISLSNLVHSRFFSLSAVH